MGTKTIITYNQDVVGMLLLYRGERFDANFYYKSGVDIDHSFFLETRGRKTLIVSKMNESLARSSFKGGIIASDDVMKTLLEKIRGKTVLFDGRSMSAYMAKKLAKVCKLKDNSEELLRFRMKKQPEEISSIKKAVAITKDVITSLDTSIAKTEEDLKKQILMLTFERGLEPAFDPIVATGKSTAYPHYSPGKKKLSDPILIDYGVKYKHYCADLTRCFVKDNKKKAQYEELQNICMTLVDSIPNCRNGSDVAKLSAKLMKWSGFPRMIHAIGHGVGLDVHELPSLGIRSKDRLGGCTMAIEPAFYLKNYGLRYEETIYFDGKKARVL